MGKICLSGTKLGQMNVLGYLFIFSSILFRERDLETFLQTLLLLKRAEDSYLLGHVDYLCILSSYCYLCHNNNRSPHKADVLCMHTLRVRHFQ